jgi:hypothetical protein
MGRTAWVRFQAQARHLSLIQVQTGSGNHPSSIHRELEPSPGVGRLGREVNHSPPSSVKILHSPIRLHSTSTVSFQEVESFGEADSR